MRDKYLIKIAELLEEATADFSSDPTDYKKGYVRGLQIIAQIVLVSIAEDCEIEVRECLQEK